MDWQDQGYILSVKKHGETSAIIEVFTPEHGRHLGLVRGGVGRRLRPVLQAGNRVHLEWRARLSEHLGYFTIEPSSLNTARLMDNRLALAGLNALCAVARETLPEREAFPPVYNAFEIVLQNMHDPEIWPALYIRWEAGLLKAMGYGLDFSSCAATGSMENLTHVSPRSGRAVSAQAAQPYIDKLLPLPGFLHGMKVPITPDDLSAGLSLTGYFLETRIHWGVNKTMPEARNYMVSALRKAGFLS